MNTIKSPFKCLCVSVGNLPTSYIESMSYYECLTYFVKFLENEVIPALNQDSEAIKELQNYYIELKEYVDNYFDELNVQTEINNKLDEMALDGTLADIINEEIFNELSSQVSTNTNDISDLKDRVIQEPYFNVLENGGHADGSTANDSIISQALLDGYKKFYFPQNSTNNASYYFTNVPDFTNCEIMNDENVILNLPHFHNAPTLQTALFHNNINKYSRENSTSSFIPSNYPMLYNMLNMNFDYTKKNIRRIQFTDASLKCYHYKFNDDYLFEEVDKSTYYEASGISINRKSGSTNNYYNGLCVPIDNKNTIETSANAKVEFVVFNNSTHEGIFGMWNNGTLKLDIYSTSSTPESLTKINLVQHNTSNSMNPANVGIYKIRYNKKQNIIEFYINDLIVGRYEPSFTPSHFGFGRSNNSNSVNFTNFLCYTSENVPLNATLKILIAGDSRFHNDGSSLSVDNILKHGLLFNGINKVEITNISVSGNSIQQIYTQLQDETLTNYDIVIIETGINNANSSSSDIADYMYNISNLLVNAGTFNIFTSCIPTAWNGTDAQATLRSTNYYRIKNAMELGICSVSGFRKFNILLENNCGNTSDNSNLPINCDGVHPNDLGLIEICRNIITGINSIFKD